MGFRNSVPVMNRVARPISSHLKMGLLVVAQKMKIPLLWHHQEWKQRWKITLLAIKVPPPPPTIEDDPTIPKTRSLAHHQFMDHKVVFVSFDIETGGEFCGILQISAEMVRLEVHPTIILSGNNKGNPSPNKDFPTNVERISNTFNKYVKPDEGAIWDARASLIHGLTENDPRILQADRMESVWGQFLLWFYSTINKDEVAVLVAYNGETCDLKWLWKLTQAPRSPYALPSEMKYFLDPLKVIKHFKGCKFNPQHSKLDSLELGMVWKHMNGGGINLNGAHDSLVDAKAQSDIIVHPSFVPYLNKSASIDEITEIFSRTKIREWKKEMEPLRPVHSPWQEIDVDHDIKWSPGPDDTYSSASGGGPAGPSSRMQQCVRTCHNIADIFLFILPITFFAQVARWTNKYCYEDWVIEKYGNDRDGNQKKRRHFVECDCKTPGRRHRADKEKKRYIITPGFVLCWFGILILQGAHFGADKRSASKLWRGPPYGVSIPYIRNTMTWDAYVFMRQYIHFCDNSKQISAGNIGHDPLFKVRYSLDTMMGGMRSAWNAGKHVTIDESMIRYMGRAISYVQYMPAKPTKHGIKVFALCCAFSAVILAFQVYVGKEDDSDGSAVAVCENLCVSAGLTTQRGRVLYTDNYYTSIKLARIMFEKYGWTIVGTIVATDKKSREDFDIPFLKLSNGARQGVKRGWMREAVIELKTPTGKSYYIQCTTWRDKKQVTFLHNSKVGFSDGMSVSRHVKGKAGRIVIDGPRAQAEYVKYFNAVDRNDRDSADYSTSIRTNRYYLRIKCWVLDRVVHTCYAVVLYSVALNIHKQGWEKYVNKNNGRHDFQIDLGIYLINRGIHMDWTGEERPDYMRKDAFIPCDCDKCYFCLNGHTSGIAHAPKKREAHRPTAIVYKCNTRQKVETCKDVKERVDIMKNSKYCKMCYRKQGKVGTVAERLKKCNTSCLGCPICKEHICDDCWKSGYDKHL